MHTCITSLNDCAIPTHFQNEFIPLGISSYFSKGRISLYVVNTHPKRPCVEIFTYHKEKNVLFHRKSVCDARFSR